MASLERSLRKDLEKTVKSARRVAEAGARKAVAQLGVGEAQAPKHLTGPQPALRNKLRAHGRQLGDRRDPKTGTQETARLVQECAYEHWHRMLFARFLAETDLLIEPESGVAITLDEVQELAREQTTDWLELASDYAERMLPQIFRKDDPVLQIALPPETRSEMEDLLKSLSKPVFEADDSLGWVYQFWQADKKDEVNKSEVKIGADELPAVTQLFTEDYMVLFLLHNTLGAWWAGKVLAGNPGLAASAPDEAALRAACKVGDIDWTYLRFVRDTAEDGTDGPWRPAAGVFDGWPRAAKDLTVLDPCMGSGHFLVFALPILVTFRITEEGLSQSAAVDAVLKDNLFGLEIDPRCTQIAAFNLAFAAWRKVGYRPLPQLNLACSGLAIGVTKAEWLKLAEKAVTAADPAAKRDLLGVEKNLLTVGLEERVKNGLGALYDLFAKAPWLGSLIDPRRAGADIFREGFDKLEPLLASILAAADTDDAREMAVAAQGMAKAAELLGKQFTLIATNVPYLGREKQTSEMRSHFEDRYEAAKADLACVMLDRFRSWVSGTGTVAVVSPQYWLFLTRYQKFRDLILKNVALHSVVRLGPGAFETISGEVVNVSLVIGSPGRTSLSGFANLDATKRRAINEKISDCSGGRLAILQQKDQFTNPDHIIGYLKAEGSITLDSLSYCYQGLATSDNSQFVLNFWEFPRIENGWEPFQMAPDGSAMLGGCSWVIHWEDGKGRYARHAEALKEAGRLGGWKSGHEAWGKIGVAVNRMGNLPSAPYLGTMFDCNVAVIIPENIADFPWIWAQVRTPEYSNEVRRLNQKASVTNLTLIKVPIAENVRSSGPHQELSSAISLDPTQWIFVPLREASKPLQVGVAQLLGFEWPRCTGSSFLGFPAATPDPSGNPADTDGIVCLTALKGAPPAEQRLNDRLADAYEADWSAAKLAGLLGEAGYASKSLDDWLRDGFFIQHCELFHQRPFIWHIWDGRRDGFHALVNYHQLAALNGEGRRTLEKLIYSYLGDWIDRQRADQTAGVEGADARLAHAEHLKAELIKILEGEPPYDIFVRWKPLHEQPIGWDPDINDGVRMNIRPFMAARTLNARGANACILRATPKIKWDKDRGKEPNRDKADYPWFWGWDEAAQDFSGAKDFDGNRWNELHYSHAFKQAARDRHRAKSGGKK